MDNIFWPIGLILATFMVMGCTTNSQEDPLAFCKRFLEVTSPEAPLSNFDFDNPESISRAEKDLSDLVSIAPAQIVEDAQIVANLYTAILQTLVSVSTSDRAGTLQQFQTDIDRALPSIEALSSYGSLKCGVIYEEESPVPTVPIPLDLNN